MGMGMDFGMGLGMGSMDLSMGFDDDTLGGSMGMRAAGLDVSPDLTKFGMSSLHPTSSTSGGSSTKKTMRVHVRPRNAAGAATGFELEYDLLDAATPDLDMDEIKSAINLDALDVDVDVDFDAPPSSSSSLGTSLWSSGTANMELKPGPADLGFGFDDLALPRFADPRTALSSPSSDLFFPPSSASSASLAKTTEKPSVLSMTVSNPSSGDGDHTDRRRRVLVRLRRIPQGL